jgi:hypothetical protein
MTEKNKCKDCKFYIKSEQIVTMVSIFNPRSVEKYTLIDQICWRSPEHVKVLENHWCGEFVAGGKGE